MGHFCEGDCLFLYNDSDDAIDGDVDHLRALYERFCEGIEEVVAGSTCTCGARDRSGALTIKFVVHSGEFDTQEIVGRTELIGPDIVVAHRLLKNTVSIREYALLTNAFGEAIDGCGYGCIASGDVYDDIGAVDYRYVDLAELQKDWRTRREVYLDDDGSDLFMAIDIDAPPQLVWDLSRDSDEATDVYPGLLELDPLTGPIMEVGGVRACLHGGFDKNVHQVVVVDHETRRTTHLISNVQVIERVIQTWECATTVPTVRRCPCATGSPRVASFLTVFATSHSRC